MGSSIPCLHSVGDNRADMKGQKRRAKGIKKINKQVRYKRWLWWTRFGMAVGALQLVGAIYLMFVIVSDLPNERRPTSCFFGWS